MTEHLMIERELAPIVAKHERSNAALDRWARVVLARKVHVIGVDESNSVTKQAGAKRAHLILRVPCWFAMAFFRLQQMFRGAE